MNRTILHPLDQTKAQAPAAVASYVVAVDAVFGEGHAVRHPELVAAFVQACAIEAAMNAGRIASRDTNETLLKLKPRLFG